MAERDEDLRVTGPSAAGTAGGTDAVEAVGDTTAGAEGSVLDALTADLAAGRIGPDEVRERLVDQALRGIAGPEIPEVQRAALRAEIEAVLLADPVLEALLRP